MTFNTLFIHIPGKLIRLFNLYTHKNYTMTQSYLTYTLKHENKDMLFVNFTYLINLLSIW